MALERSGERKFTELVADHIFRNKYRNMLSTVMDGKRMPDHLREDGRTSRPSLDNTLFVARI